MSEGKDPASPPASLAKYSRYRSVRQQQAEASKSPPPPPQQEKTDDATPVVRSMSRYRRPSYAVPKNSEQTTTSPQNVPQIPALPRVPDLSRPTRRVTEPAPQRRPAAGNEWYGGGRQHAAGSPRETETERLQRKAREIREREEKQRRAEREVAEPKQRVDAEREAEEILAEQKRKDLERLEAELDAAAAASSAVPASAPARATSSKEKFGFFSRKRAATKGASSGSAASGSRTTSEEPQTRSLDVPPRGSEQSAGNGPPISEPHVRSQDPPRVIEAGGGGIVPGIDAPISAVNAGERRVLVRCKQSSINLPITPETTPVDLIYSAANVMTQAISPSTAILLESYNQLGLERRIRRYEHIRDVMNSWDRDTQNALILQNSDSPNHDRDLEAASVPREVPASVSIHMYHSQKPGKWSKRHVTLLGNGQIYISKKPNSKASDKDVANICHLSDFDIYTPTPQQIRKHLKPPKKHCVAIKSQQKTTMFLSTENFVHFFCTDEEHMAEQWYSAVQEWRSWYLVNRMGEGNKTKGKSVTELSTRVPARTGTKSRPAHKVKVSVDESPYTIGTFSSLMDMDRFASSASTEPEEYESEEENRPRQIPFHLRNSISLSPLPDPRGSKRRHPPPVSYRLPPEAEDEFASSGLLGRTYSQRQRQLREREAAQLANQPFLDGPSLLNNVLPKPSYQRTMSLKTTNKPSQSPETSSTVAGAGTGATLQRASSKREKPKPLLDFTPQFKEAPQWDRTGKGRGVTAVAGVPLVDVATTPESALAEMPRATLLRREGTAVGRPRTGGGGKGAEGAFVKGGLVAGL